MREKRGRQEERQEGEIRDRYEGSEEKRGQQNIEQEDNK